MIFIAFGRWNSAHGRWFTRERIYWRGWTPFVRVSWRYKEATTVRIKAAFLTACSMAGLVVIPYLLGRLMAFVFPDAIGDSYWFAGTTGICAVLVAYAIWYVVYGAIYDYLKERAI